MLDLIDIDFLWNVYSSILRERPSWYYGFAYQIGVWKIRVRVLVICMH